MKLILAILALLLISGVVIVQYDEVAFDTQTITANVSELDAVEFEDDEFLRVYEPVPFEFPADHGPHPDYRAEWWYYTGNLADADGNRYGYQFTIFRRGLLRGDPQRASEWASREIYFAHFTVTDVTGGTFIENERFSRHGAGLAGAQADPYHVWIDDWIIKEVGPNQIQLKAEAEEVAIDLMLVPQKPIVLQGIDGYSNKSTGDPGNSSYYYSITDHAVTGTVTTPRGTFEVTGDSWLDREWSTSDLGEDAVGWDWFSLQLDDNREVMLYLIRLEDGGYEPVSAGTVVAPDGTTSRITWEDVNVEVLDTWTSDESGTTYPAEWQFSIPEHNIDLHIKPMLPHQELNVSYTYWEGAVRVEGTHTGYGYVEMTGYRESMQGRF